MHGGTFAEVGRDKLRQERRKAPRLIVRWHDATAASFAHATWPSLGARMRLNVPHRLRRTLVRKEAYLYFFLICRGLEGNSYTRREDQRMHPREQLSSEQLKL